MKKLVVVPACLVAMVLVMSLNGCKADPSAIRKSIEVSAQATSLYGLKKWGKTKPDAAKECATTLLDNINTELMPYMDGAQLRTSAEIAAMLNSSLFKKIDPDIKDLIESASIILDEVLPVPSPTTYLNQDQISYIKAFLAGLSEGCNQYLGVKTRSIINKSKWIGSK